MESKGNRLYLLIYTSSVQLLLVLSNDAVVMKLILILMTCCMDWLS